jgi:hypothetical protein
MGKSKKLGHKIFNRSGAESAETSMRRVFAVLQRVEIRLCGAAPPFSLLPCVKTGYYFNITFRTKETGC